MEPDGGTLHKICTKLRADCPNAQSPVSGVLEAASHHTRLDFALPFLGSANNSKFTTAFQVSGSTVCMLMFRVVSTLEWRSWTRMGLSGTDR
jgi:hypothetical protein